MQFLNEIQSLNYPIPLPQTLLEVRQHFNMSQVEDVSKATQQALESGGFLEQITPNAQVAVAVGSRGIASLANIVRTTITSLRSMGAQPFVIPAMGSHGGATPEGQRAVLAELGVTPDTVGAEIRATMDVVRIGQIPGGPPLFQDALSHGADHTILINRVKPHTDFRGEIESGLAKMEVIGLGKQQGALAVHAWGAPGFCRFLSPAARLYETNSNVMGGLAVLESAHDQVVDIVPLNAAEIGGPKEAQLLAHAKTLMASLPFHEIDVLVVQRMGKNISGTGMDTNIIGRLMIPRQPETFGGPDIAVIAVLDLTKETHGNAIGMGLADVTTARLAAKVDWASTYTNAITAGSFGVRRVSLPLTMPDDRRALQVALRGCVEMPDKARFVFIRDTLALERLWVSPSLRREVESHSRLSLVSQVPLAFAHDGMMTSPWQMDYEEDNDVGDHAGQIVWFPKA